MWFLKFYLKHEANENRNLWHADNSWNVAEFDFFSGKKPLISRLASVEWEGHTQVARRDLETELKSSSS